MFSAVKEVLENNSIQVNRIGQTVSDQFQNTEKQHLSIHQTPSDELKHLLVPAKKLLANLSYSHLQELASITNLTKRTFLEIEAVNNAWSVKELKRQINTLYYERSGISKKPDKLSKIVNQKAERLTAEDIIKSPFTFEFLGLKAKDVVYENDLEKALLERLEEFLIEMGNGQPQGIAPTIEQNVGVPLARKNLLRSAHFLTPSNSTGVKTSIHKAYLSPYIHPANQ